MDQDRPPIDSVDALAAHIELPLLAPVLSEEQVHAGLLVAREHALAAVCVRPCDVDTAVRGLSSSNVRVASTVSYPDGSSTASVKIYEAKDLLRRGAQEIEVVVNLGMMYSRQFVRVESELQQLAALCAEKDAKLKAVFEFPVLNHELRVIACKLARRTGCHYVVNSTGRVRQENLQSEIQLALDRRFGLFAVKAVGFEETSEAVLGLLHLGVERLAVRKPDELLEAFRRKLESSRRPQSDIPATIS
jgi:deoxyribose-phosphate aldolase